MKKFSTWLSPFMLSTLILILASCEKQRAVPSEDVQIVEGSSHGPVTRGYHDSFDADLHFVPDIAAGWTYPSNSPAWFYGMGEGNATHMGKVQTYFNTYTLKNSAGVTMVYARPVTMFYSSQLQSYNLPSDVSSIIIDEKGNSIWGRFAPAGLTSWHIDASHIGMSGTIFIVGGTGKFEGASGEGIINAVFNQFNLTECSIWTDGSINY